MKAVNRLESDSMLPVSLKPTELEQLNCVYHNETETKNYKFYVYNLYLTDVHMNIYNHSPIKDSQYD
jgi:hypothetical protein